MAQRFTLDEIRTRTYKDRDAWWTVLLVDPLAARLVRLVAPYRWITPNLLTGLAMLLGVASAACFLAQDRRWLIAGAVLFHLSFVVDCMDGKIARLNGTGSMFGAWFDFMFDRIRVFLCAIALFGGQYAATGQVAFLWTLVVVTFLDLFRYVNSQQMAKTRQSMRDLLQQARGPVPDAPVPSEPLRPQGPRARFRAALLQRRIRTHLFSGIEFEMTVFIIGPLTGRVIAMSVLAGTLLVVFELLLIYKLYGATKAYTRELAKFGASQAEATGAEDAEDAEDDELSPQRISA
jgi:phosphatidylglycerophosphate synthase